MICKQCGKYLPENAKFCAECGGKVENQSVTEQRVDRQVEQTQSPIQQTVNTVQKPRNPLIGKTYSFRSTAGGRGVFFLSVFTSKIDSTVEVSEKKLHISTYPARFNQVPEIGIEDITSIDVSTHINGYNWLWIIVSAIAGFALHWIWFLGTAFFVFTGRDNRITIYQKYGYNAVLYSADKSIAETFQREILSLRQ